MVCVFQPVLGRDSGEAVFAQVQSNIFKKFRRGISAEIGAESAGLATPLSQMTKGGGGPIP